MKNALFYFIILFSTNVCGQDYKIECNFDSNKVYHFTVKRAKFDSREPITKELATLTQVEAIFTQMDKGLKCIWKYGETKVIGTDSIISQIGSQYSDMVNIYRGIEIEVLFDPNLGGIELLNFAKMKENIKNGLLKVYEDQNTIIDSATMVLINQQLEPTYSYPDVLLLTYFPEITLYFNFYGQNFSKGFTIRSEYTYPNSFGGDPLPVVSEMVIDSKEDDILVVKNVEKLNQEEANRIIKETIEKLSKLGNSPLKQEEIPDFRIYSEAYCYYNIRTKMIQKVKKAKIIVIAGVNQTELLEIKEIK